MAIKSGMGLSRRSLNLIVDNRIPGIKSLCSMDLDHLFSFPAASTWIPGTTTQKLSADAGCLKNEAAAALKMESIQIQPPHFTLGASTSAPSEQCKIDCFPLAGSEFICTDHLGRAFNLDAQSRLGGTMPSLNKPKRIPVSIFIQKPDDYMRYGNYGCGNRLFVMERTPEPEVGCTRRYSNQFEVYVSSKASLSPLERLWRCHLLPPPPYVREPKYCHIFPEISSYAVLDGGSQICISVHDVGTYCLDTESFTWKEIGKWMLPFRGKVEYVPELKLWFGFSAKDRHLAAADLSSISIHSQPQLIDLGKELDHPEEWKECKDSQLVNLGAGMFCVTRFFHARTLHNNFGDKSIDEEFAVFTGVELVTHILDPNGNANSSGSEKGELRMTPHKSRCHMTNGTSISAVF